MEVEVVHEAEAAVPSRAAVTRREALSAGAAMEVEVVPSMAAVTERTWRLSEGADKGPD